MVKVGEEFLELLEKFIFIRIDEFLKSLAVINRAL